MYGRLQGHISCLIMDIPGFIPQYAHTHTDTHMHAHSLATKTHKTHTHTLTHTAVIITPGLVVIILWSH